jgi:hypothetical protein
MEPTNVQILFFQHLKSSLPAHMSMVDNVADLLQISTDSVTVVSGVRNLFHSMN